MERYLIFLLRMTTFLDLFHWIALEAQLKDNLNKISRFWSISEVVPT